ncbi:MAG: hypothetical protein ACRDT6_16285 [Micromonosporaceae bacterium]
MRTHTRIIGLLTAAVATVAALGIAPQSASAATPTGPAAPRTSGETVGTSNTTTYCTGTRVKRCLEIVWYDSYSKAYTYGWITDTPHDGYSYDVAVSNLRVQYNKNGTWTTVNSTIDNDYDGWQGYRDLGTSHTFYCGSTGNVWAETIRARAYFKWRRMGSSTYSGQWLNSYSDTCY